jgi:hypothetical protein
MTADRDALAAEQIAHALRELPPMDRALADAIFEAEDQVTIAALIRQYYRDLDRAERTPRPLLYVHMGMLAGIIDNWQHKWINQ